MRGLHHRARSRKFWGAGGVATGPLSRLQVGPAKHPYFNRSVLSYHLRMQRYQLFLHCGAFDPSKVLRAPYLFSGWNTQRYFLGSFSPITPRFDPGNNTAPANNINAATTNRAFPTRP
jgi:hypothetical protein